MDVYVPVRSTGILEEFEDVKVVYPIHKIQKSENWLASFGEHERMKISGSRSDWFS